MNAIRRKLRSREGASLTFALLLFLVCAIISSVVIVAASTTAGRMSERAGTDQRYYAVTSAAGLLRDEFNGATAVVEYSYIGDNKNAIAPKLVKLEGVDTSRDHAILKDASELLVQKLAVAPEASGADRTLLLTSDVADAAYLNCDIREYVLDKKKQLVFEISSPAVETSAESGEGTPKPQVFTMCVTFNANVSQSEAKVAVAAAGGTQQKTTTTTTIGWTLASIRKGGYNP